MATIRNGKKLDDELRRLGRKIGRGAALRVGFLENATYPGEEDQEALPVATVAAWQNFGTAKIPARPFFSNMVANKSPEWGRILANLIEKHGVEKGMSLMGEGIRAQLQESIRETNDPPLSPITLMLRKMRSEHPGVPITGASLGEAARRVKAGEQGATGTHAKPLIDTSNMINSVDYEVDVK